jgi:hypothetical protein
MGVTVGETDISEEEAKAICARVQAARKEMSSFCFYANAEEWFASLQEKQNTIEDKRTHIDS